MALRRNTVLWIVWGTATLLAGGALAWILLVSGDRSAMLIGATTDAHHQIELSCDSCHAAEPFTRAAAMSEAMNDACLSCHRDELKVSDDSHPISKFRDPRNFDRLEKLNAVRCATCHVEHKPEITRVSAVTLPMDYCMACHQDVGENRPSHEGLSFDTCASAGCHNYHDNRALYEDFLVEHAGEPWLHPEPLHESNGEFRAARTQAPALTAADAHAPAAYLANGDVVADWAASAHAAEGVNCAGCHALALAEDHDDAPVPLDALDAAWEPRPGRAVCADCHRNQAKTFAMGKHGMRAHPELAAPRPAPDWLPASLAGLVEEAPLDPFPVAEARLPMTPEAHGKTVGDCGACHESHRMSVATAAVDACAFCHDDPHTRAYFGSPHHALWQAEMAGELPPGVGVSCGDCHMPKVEDEWTYEEFTTHNQNAYLRPNEKMIRPVCMDCHGLAFAIDSLADRSLVDNNFEGRPARHVESIDWAVRRVTETDEE